MRSALRFRWCAFRNTSSLASQHVCPESRRLPLPRSASAVEPIWHTIGAKTIVRKAIWAHRHGLPGIFWGENLLGVRSAPVQLSRPRRLVYSPHSYGPAVYDMSYFKGSDFPHNLAALWVSGAAWPHTLLGTCVFDFSSAWRNALPHVHILVAACSTRMSISDARQGEGRASR